MEAKKITRATIGEHLFDRELKIIGKTRIDVIDDDKWFYNFTMKRDEYSNFRDYSIKLMMKTFRCNKNKASETFNWYWLQFGVKLKG